MPTLETPAIANRVADNGRLAVKEMDNKSKPKAAIVDLGERDFLMAYVCAKSGAKYETGSVVNPA